MQGSFEASVTVYQCNIVQDARRLECPTVFQSSKLRRQQNDTYNEAEDEGAHSVAGFGRDVIAELHQGAQKPLHLPQGPPAAAGAM